MTEKPFRPMKAEDGTMQVFERIIEERGYLLASYKLDGIRCVIRDKEALSNTLKPIPNKYVRDCLSKQTFNGFDGELIVGVPYGEGVFARTSSGVMSHGGQPDFTYWVFDFHDQPSPFHVRSKAALNWVEMMQGQDKFLRKVEQFKCNSVDQLMQWEETAVIAGYEGLIVRDPEGPYKYGRSTLKQGWMLKLKRFHDSEAEIIGFEELMHNANEARLDERGLTKRSSEKAGQVPAGMLGALQVRDIHRGWTFNIGTGLDHALRAAIWQGQESYLGLIVSYKYLAVGMKDLPRHPVFKAFRSKEDLAPEPLREQIDEEGLLG